MKTGIRFTCLKNGDNLLGQTWEYKGYLGVEAVEQKLYDMFYHVKSLEIDTVIDTIVIGKDATNNVYLPNTGVNGDLWKMSDRLSIYKECAGKYKLNLMVELEFPTVVTEFNYQQYAQYATEIIDKYSFIKYWQIMTVPEELDESGMQKCPPAVYVQLMKYIYETINHKYSDINIGGAGIFEAVNEYVDSAYINEDKEVYHTGWLAEATGEFYGTDTKYDATEACGFLPYIDFFAFQGDSSTGIFKYSTFPLVVAKLKEGLIAQAQRNGINLDIPFMSTKQGHFADKTSNQDLQLQAYRDLKEYMSDFIVDVIPFKRQLVDEFYNPLDGNAKKNVYGLLYYYLGNDRKPAYQQFSFILKKLAGYNSVCRDELMIKAKRPYEYTSEVLSVMFINDAKDKILTVIYPSSERIVATNNKIFTKVTLKPAINRVVYIPNGTKVQIDNPTDVNFKNYDFIVVEENLVVDTKTNENLSKEIELKLKFYETYVHNWLEHLPNDYNKEVYDTNFYNLIRSIAMEFGDMRYEFNILEENGYLQTAHGDAIYNNFGALIGLKWKRKWSEEQYRTAVSGILEGIFHGAHKNSIQKAIKGYTGFDVTIYEMFKDYEHYGLTQDLNWDNQYRFTVEVEKDLDDTQDLKEVFAEVKEAVDYVKPAHTLPIIMIVLVGKEDYREWYKERYGRDFADSDEFQMDIMQLEESNKFGWKAHNYDWVLQSDSKHSINVNSAFPIGARYTLYDRMWLDITTEFNVLMPKPKEDLLALYEVWYEDIYDRKIKDELNYEFSYHFSEAKFGIKPTVTDRVLKTNGGFIYDKDDNIIGSEHRKTNYFVTGFKYALYDEYWMLFEYYGEEKYPQVKDQLLYLEYKVFWEEFYKKPTEDFHMGLDVALEELKFGLVPYYDRTMITYTKNPRRRNQRITNHHVYGIRNRLWDEPSIEPELVLEEKTKITKETAKIESSASYTDKFETPTENMSGFDVVLPALKEEIPKATDSCSISMYTVDTAGNMTVIRQESE